MSPWTKSHGPPENPIFLALAPASHRISRLQLPHPSMKLTTLGASEMIISLDLKDKRVVVVGSSDTAVARAARMVEEGASVKLILLDFPSSLPSLDVREIVQKKGVAKKDLRGAFLVLATDRNKALNIELKKLADEMGFLLNTLDEKTTSNYFNVAIRRIGPSIELAVSTSGASPAFASRLSTRLANQVTETDIRVFERFSQARRELQRLGIPTSTIDWDELELNVRSNELRDRGGSGSLNAGGQDDHRFHLSSIDCQPQLSRGSATDL